MNDPNRPFKWLFVITMVALCIAVLYPPSERLKGGIDLVSSPGDGSTFTVRLPLPEAGPVTEEMPVAG